MAGRKRKATTPPPPASSPSRRQSARAKKISVTYAESDAADPSSSDEFNDATKSESEAEVSEVDVEEIQEEEEEEEDYDSEPSTKKHKGWKKTILSDGRTQMVIDIPGKKDAGNTPYEDGRIHPNTMEFLGELKENNKREWLKFHDEPFRQAEKDFHSFVSECSTIVYSKDPTIPELPVKDIIYRIHRDMRFTPDPTPYKPYFAVTWSRTGRKGPYAHYYLHIQPGEQSFCGGGYFGCDAETLACLREDIDTQPHQFKSILTDERVRSVFFPGVKKEEGKIVKAFCEMSKRDALKKKPKGFDADHKDIELLKLRNFILTKKISDKEIAGKDGLRVVGDIVGAIEPFITYLNATVMPDPDGDD